MSEFFHLSEDDLATPTALTSEQAVDLKRLVADKKSFQDVGENKKYVDTLLNTPGVDPVLAIADGHPEDIPEEGWLLTSHIAPGYGGVIHITRYHKGAFNGDNHVSDSREKFGQARLHYKFDGAKGGFGEHTVAYENPNYPDKNTPPTKRMSGSAWTGIPWESTEIIELANGGRLLDQLDPLTVHNKGSMSSSMDWNDYSSRERKMHEVDVNRVVSGHEEVGGVLVSLGFGMGLEQQDVRKLLETIADKVAQA